jgi:phage-related tail fiber protein
VLIQIKRSPNSAAPSSLAPGELAWVEGTKTGYLGLIAGGIAPIFGDGAGYLKGNQNITFTGDVTGSGSTNVALALATQSGLASGTYTKITVNAKGLVTGGAALSVSDIPAQPISQITGLQAALDSKPTLVNGVLPNSVLPPLSITDTFVVASQAAMLALTAQRGDVAVRTDISSTFILQSDNPATLSNWVQLITPSSASGGVQTVNSLTGPNITLAATNIPFTPAGGVASTNVQAAIAELDTKKLSANQNITFTGDATGSGTTAVALTLATQAGLTAGAYTKLTVNTKGLVTAAANLTASDIPAIAQSQVTGLVAALGSKLDATAVIDGGTF